MVFLSGLASISWCPTALKLGQATYFCLLHTPISAEFCFSFLGAIAFFSSQQPVNESVVGL